MKNLYKIFQFIWKLCKNYPTVTSLLFLILLLQPIWLQYIIQHLDIYFTPDISDKTWIQFCENGSKYYNTWPNSDWNEFSYNEKRFAFYYEKFYYKFINFCLIIFPLSFTISLVYALNLPFYNRIYLPINKLIKKLIKNLKKLFY